MKDITDRLHIERPAELFVDPALLQQAMQLPEFADSAESLQEIYKAWFGK